MTKKRFRKLLMATRTFSRNESEDICEFMLKILRSNPGTAAFGYFASFMDISGYSDFDSVNSQYPDGMRVRILHDDFGRGTITTRTPGYYTAEMELRLLRAFAGSADYLKDKNGNIARR